MNGKNENLAKKYEEEDENKSQQWKNRD